VRVGLISLALNFKRVRGPRFEGRSPRRGRTEFLIRSSPMRIENGLVGNESSCSDKWGVALRRQRSEVRIPSVAPGFQMTLRDLPENRSSPRKQRGSTRRETSGQIVALLAPPGAWQTNLGRCCVAAAEIIR
jgi:hypothetical protein